MIYLFWTGGYDSTFRLCQLLIKLKKKVQPIYISDPNLDNYSDKKTKRKNHKQEIKAMEKIKNILLEKFDHIKKKKLLMPLIIIKDTKYDDEIRTNMEILKKKRYVRRSQCQYGGMAQVTKNIQQKIEVCAEIGGFFQKKLKNKIFCDKQSCYIKHFNNEDKCLSIFKRFLLPIINYTKEDMFKESLEYDFDTILGETWSCWYPKKNKPCNRCDMCRHRLNILKNNKNIIETFEIMKNEDYIIKKENKNKILFFMFIIFYLIYFLITTSCMVYVVR